MKLGAFSISMAVKDINASLDFYQKLGFEQAGGEIEKKWLMLRNGDTVIGLFEGMFDKNMLTFNPGWDQQCNQLKDFDDVRDVQKQLQSLSVRLDSEVEIDSKGPGNFMLTDPDGNPILIDQHV